MNIQRLDIDALNAKIVVTIDRTDCDNDVNTKLKEYKRKANVPGFRPGMVPMGLVQKMYGKYVFVEVLNQKLSDGLYNYIKDNNINILGEPLPSADQKEFDFENGSSFEYVFDVAIAPEVDAKTKIPFYDIAVTDKMVDDQVQSYAGRFGSYFPAEVAEERDMIKGAVKEVAGDVEVEDAVLCPAYIKEAKQRKLFIGAKVGDKVTFSPAKAYENNETEIASFLKIDKEKVMGLSEKFEFTIREITRYVDSPVDQSLFDKVFGKDVVKNVEDFRVKVKDELTATFAENANYRFALDAKEVLLKKNAKVAFPEAFLKRWLLEKNDNKDKNLTPEKVDAEFPAMLEELKWQLICDKIASENDVKIDEEDVLEESRRATRAQFAQYGMGSVPDELIENYAKETMQRKEARTHLAERALETKIVGVIKSKVKVEQKSISVEDFGKLFEKR